MNKYFFSVLKNQYADFKGTATRTQYWMFVLYNVLFSVVLIIPAIFIGAFVILLAIYALALIVPHVAITARRVRDAGLNPYWTFLMLPYFIVNVLNQIMEPNGLLTLIAFVALISNIALFVISVLPTRAKAQ